MCSKVDWFVNTIASLLFDLNYKFELIGASLLALANTECDIIFKRDDPDHQLNIVFHNLFCDSLKTTLLIIGVRKTYMHVQTFFNAMATENITF